MPGRSLQASARALKDLKDLKDQGDFAGQEDAPKVAKKREPKYILPIVDNFKRTKQGYKLMAQELVRLVVEQAKRMPQKALLDVNGEKISYKHEGKHGMMTIEELKTKGPVFLDSYLALVCRVGWHLSRQPSHVITSASPCTNSCGALGLPRQQHAEDTNLLKKRRKRSSEWPEKQLG